MEIEDLAEHPRVTARNAASPHTDGGCVVYWMDRAQRGVDNPALDVAIEAGNLLEKPVVVFLCLRLHPGAKLRHLQFVREGLPELAKQLVARRVGFVLRDRDDGVEAFASEVKACLVIGDENPLRHGEAWRRRVAEGLDVPLLTVDADVVVPTRVIGREHWAARTIRPRIHEQLPRFLVKTPDRRARVDWSARGVASLDPAAPRLSESGYDRRVSPVAGFRGGPKEARARLFRFVRERLAGYAELRNRPEHDATSQLSPYLHFGHIGPRAIALAVEDADAPEADRAAFLEELIVRRELGVNYVRYNAHYDRLEGCERWAKATLSLHAEDPRELVPERLLAAGESPDPLWNAAQRQMLETGWMHGYLRMYWAKRLLEWTQTPEEALAIGIALNDAYELDGSDPNGYTGVAWAVGGKHDRAFAERPVFGKVRYMSPTNTARKFDARAYVERYVREAAPAAAARLEAE